MHGIYELKDMLCEELEKYGEKKDLTAGSLEVVDKLAHTVKNLDKIIESYEEEDGEYSGAMYDDGMSYERGGNRGNQGGGRSNRGGSYRGSYEGSYARNGRGRGSRAKRDSMGRYSSEGYSRAADDVVERMRDLMQDAPDEQTRQEIQRLVSRMESMM